MTPGDGVEDGWAGSGAVTAQLMDKSWLGAAGTGTGPVISTGEVCE